MENTVSNQIKTGDYEGATNTDSRITLESDSLYFRLTGLASLYNVLWDDEITPYGIWEEYVTEPGMRAALHVGERQLADGSDVYMYLNSDMMLSVKPWLDALLDAGLYRVLLYSGQLDMLVPYSGTVNVARALVWSGAERFKNATRTIWRVQGPEENTADVAGYATSYGPLTVLLVRNAGHMVSYDQPARAHEMINRFTSGKPFQ